MSAGARSRGAWVLAGACLASAAGAEDISIRARIAAIANASLGAPTPSTVGLLRGALADPAPEVRASAARVADTIGADVLSELKAALEREAQPEVAAEIRRVVARMESVSVPDEADTPLRGPLLTRTVRAGDYPAGFVSAVLEDQGCKGKADAFEATDIEFDPSGHRRRHRPVKSVPSSEPCRRALDILAVNAVSFDDERLVRLVLSDQREFLACVVAHRPGQAEPPARSRDRGAARPVKGGNIKEPTKVRSRNPVYPDSAKDSHIQGLVIAEATISPSGCVEAVKVLRGVDPALDIMALNSVAAWGYTPTLLNGVPVPVIMTVTVNFRMN